MELMEGGAATPVQKAVAASPGLIKFSAKQAAGIFAKNGLTV
jgi:hypothetical protein